jgi:colanic acid biosynthesis glycosyl transferase WcaI
MFNINLGLRMLHGWCNFVYRRAAKITVIAPGMKKKLIERRVPAEKIEVIYNWCDDALISRIDPSPALAESLGMKGKFNIVFAGNIGKAQALDKVIDAAHLLAARCPNLQFVFFGVGVELDMLKEKARLLGLNNVIFHGRKPIIEIGQILRLADVLFVHLRDVPLFRITIPSKTQAYMAIGRPLLIGVKGDAAELVEKAKAGLVCEPENPQDIAKRILEFVTMRKNELDAIGANGKRFYEQELSFNIGVSKYEKIFADVARGTDNSL